MGINYFIEQFVFCSFLMGFLLIITLAPIFYFKGASLPPKIIFIGWFVGSFLATVFGGIATYIDKIWKSENNGSGQ